MRAGCLYARQYWFRVDAVRAGKAGPWSDQVLMEGCVDFSSVFLVLYVLHILFWEIPLTGEKDSNHRDLKWACYMMAVLVEPDCFSL